MKETIKYFSILLGITFFGYIIKPLSGEQTFGAMMLLAIVGAFILLSKRDKHQKDNKRSLKRVNERKSSIC